MKIAICITTRDRKDTFDKCYQEITNNFPYGKNIEAKRFVVDDASKNTVPLASYRFDKQVGIAKSKNKCLELAHNWGADHIFLFDDDCYPIQDNWWRPYIESGENHLMYQFKIPNKPSSDMRILHKDDKLISYSHTRGAMIYVTRKVLDTVGGFDEEYNTYYEHPDYTNRIHNAGLSTYRAADVVGSSKLLYCLDQDGKVKSSISDSVRSENLKKNYVLYIKNKGSKQFKDFK